MINKFHLRYTSLILESRDWQSPSFADLEAAWWYLITA